MMSLAPQPWLREVGRHLRVRSRALVSLLVDALLLVAWSALLAVAGLIGLEELPPRDARGWLVFLAAVLLALMTLAVVVRFLWWDLRTLAARFRTGEHRGDGGAAGRPAVPPGAEALASPKLLDLARSPGLLPLERPARQAWRVLAARAGLLGGVALANLLLLGTALFLLQLGRLLFANLGAAVIAAAALGLLALIAREMRVLRQLLRIDVREAEAQLLRQVPELQRAQLRLLEELKAESKRLVEAREHQTAFSTPEMRQVVDQIGAAATGIAGVSREVGLAAGQVREAMQAFDRRSRDTHQVMQALVSAIADHVSEFDRAASAMTGATQRLTASLTTGTVHHASGAGGNGHAAYQTIPRPEDDEKYRAPTTPLHPLANNPGSEPMPATDHVAVRHDLGLLLARRYQHGGDLGLASEAVRQFEQALERCPARAPARPSIRHSLGNLYRLMYDRTGNEEYARAAQKHLHDLLEQS